MTLSLNEVFSIFSESPPQHTDNRIFCVPADLESMHRPVDQKPNIHLGQVALSPVIAQETLYYSTTVDLLDAQNKMRQSVAKQIRDALSDATTGPDQAWLLIKQIEQVPIDEQAPLRQLVAEWIKRMLLCCSEDSEMFIDLIKYAPEGEQAELRELAANLIQKALSSSNDIANVPDKIRFMGLIDQALEDEQAELRRLAAEQLEAILAEDTSSTILKAQAIKNIDHIPEQDQARFRQHATQIVKELLTDAGIFENGIRRGAELIKYAALEDQTSLRQQLGQWLRNKLLAYKKDSMFYNINAEDIIYIEQASDEEIPELRQIAADQIAAIVASSTLNFDAKYSAVRLIDQLPEDQQAKIRPLVATWLQYVLSNYTRSLRIMSMAITQIEQAPEDRRSELWQLAAPHLTTGIPGGEKYFLRSPLHDKASAANITEFTKTGTETFILPSKDEASIRVIPTTSAITWVDAFANWPAWHEAGFNYVPVEPILAAAVIEDDQLPSENLTAVVTTNLRGRSYAKAINLFAEHISQLEHMRQIIESTLDKMSVTHGHLHRNNFVITPYVGSDGNIDYTRCPRLYVIDFDQSTSRQ